MSCLTPCEVPDEDSRRGEIPGTCPRLKVSQVTESALELIWDPRACALTT